MFKKSYSFIKNGRKIQTYILKPRNYFYFYTKLVLVASKVQNVFIHSSSIESMFSGVQSVLRSSVCLILLWLSDGLDLLC